MNPEKRITAHQALKHPFFEDLYDSSDDQVMDCHLDFSFEHDSDLKLPEFIDLIK